MFVMRRLVLILILTVSFQSLTKANDIKDFEIEGISVDGSLLDYFTEKKIKNKSRLDAFDYLNKKRSFYYAEFYKEPFFKKYDAVQVILKFNDTNYKIYGVNAGIFIDGKKCLQELEKGKKELSSFFKNISPVDQPFTKLKQDKSGKSIFGGIAFFFDSGSISLKCYDWSENVRWDDSLRMSIKSKEYNNFLTN
ncbi:hypothetical protein OA074_00925 [bacterium]|nr:hypothetical protein [bacterium]